MTHSEINVLIKELSEVFDVVRLVDAEMTTQYSISEDGTIVRSEHRCYTVWNRGQRCENCTSAKALLGKCRVTKCEFRDGDICFVVSKYIEVDGAPYVLEVVTKITDESMFDTLGKEAFIRNVMEYNKKLYTDTLTGAYNRGYYESQMKNLRSLGAVAMVDIDNFKHINDTYGHAAGDEVLRALVRLIKDSLCSDDAVVRYGGDEFVLVFRQAQRDSLKSQLETLRRRFTELRLEGCEGLRASVSIGAALIIDNAEDSLKLADKRMYCAKQTKNTVCCED